MTSKVDIWNQALMGLGITQEVESEADRTTVARVCRRWYNPIRRTLLQDFPWPFATRSVALALLDTEYPGWDYVYSYPDKCLMVRRVVDQDSSRFPLKIIYTDWSASILTPVKIPFNIILHPSNDDQRAIATDLAEAYAICTFDVENEAIFDPLFTDALAWKLAAVLGPSLQAGGDFIKNAGEQALIFESKARAQAFNESQSDPVPESPSISVRW